MCVIFNKTFCGHFSCKIIFMDHVDDAAITKATCWHKATTLEARNVHTKYSVRYFYSNNAISREIYWNDKKVYRQYFPKKMHFLEFRALWNVHFVDLRNLRNWKFNQEYWMFTFIIFITLNLPKSNRRRRIFLFNLYISTIQWKFWKVIAYQKSIMFESR